MYKRKKIIECINIDMFIPYEDIDDCLLLQEKIRVLKLENVTEESFLSMFDFIYNSYVEEHEFILHPIQNFKFIIKGKTRDKKNIINLPKCFKSALCVVCLTEKPKVLFCNCGHIPICVECSKIKKFTECPFCKTLNEIVRIIE